MGCSTQMLAVGGPASLPFLCLIVWCGFCCRRRCRRPEDGEISIGNEAIKWHQEKQKEDKKVHIIWDLDMDKVGGLLNHGLKNGKKEGLDDAGASQVLDQPEDETGELGTIPASKVDLSCKEDFRLVAIFRFAAGKALQSEPEAEDEPEPENSVSPEITELTDTMDFLLAGHEEVHQTLGQRLSQFLDTGAGKSLVISGGRAVWKVGGRTLEGTRRLDNGVLHEVCVEYSKEQDCFTLIVDGKDEASGLYGMPDPSGKPFQLASEGLVQDLRVLINDLRVTDGEEEEDEVAGQLSERRERLQPGQMLLPLEDGERVEYYSATHSLWLGAAIDMERKIRQPLDPKKVLVDVVLSHNSMIRTGVNLWQVRRPLRHGEFVSFFSPKHQSWLRAVTSGPQSDTNTTRGYTIHLLDNDHLPGNTGQVIPNVPAKRLKRRFPPGCLVEVYQGVEKGWVPGIVEGVHDFSNSPRRSRTLSHVSLEGPSSSNVTRGVSLSSRSTPSIVGAVGEFAPDFEVHEGTDVPGVGAPGTSVHEMPAHDLAACKAICTEFGFGAFVVRNEVAHFTTKGMEECRQLLTNASHSCVYLCPGVTGTPKRHVPPEAADRSPPSEWSEVHVRILDTHDVSGRDIASLRIIPSYLVRFKGQFKYEVGQAERFRRGAPTWTPRSMASGGSPRGFGRMTSGLAGFFSRFAGSGSAARTPRSPRGSRSPRG